MAIYIRRGTSKVLQLCLEGCSEQTYIWRDLGSIRVRLTQGAVVIDKRPVIDKNDSSCCLVYYSQADTIRLKSGMKARLQVFTLKESSYHQTAIKSEVFEIPIEESLWDTEVTDGKYTGTESLSFDSPEYQEPIGHDYYGHLHLKINEFQGIISEVSGAILQGSTLVYNKDTETLLSS